MTIIRIDGVYYKAYMSLKDAMHALALNNVIPIW